LNKKHLITVQLPIRWGDMDAIGHVNNTVFFRYMEQTRIEWLDRAKLPIDRRQEGPILGQASCTFRKPLVYPGTVEVQMFNEPPGRSSVVTLYEIRLAGDDTLYAEGTGKIVWVDYAAGKSKPLPDAVRALLA